VQIIIHDDSSTDGSWEKIQGYLPKLRAKFTEVICEQSNHNLGMLKAYLRLTEMTPIRGRYLSILESDDYYFPARIQRIVEYFETHPSIGFVHSATLHIWHDSARKEYYHVPSEIASGWVFERLLNVNFANQCSIAFRHEVFEQIDRVKIISKNYKLLDYAVNLAAARIAEWGYIDEVLAAYRVHPGSASRPDSVIKRYEFGKSTLQVTVDAAMQAAVSPVVMHKVLKNYHYFVFRGSALVGNFSDFDKSLQWLREHNPQALNSPPDCLRTWFFSKRALRSVFRIIYYNPLLTTTRRFVARCYVLGNGEPRL